MIVLSAEGSRTGKLPSTPLRRRRMRGNNYPIITFTRRVLDNIAGTFLELPVCYKTVAYGLVFCRAGSNDRQHDNGDRKDEAEFFAHDFKAGPISPTIIFGS